MPKIQRPKLGKRKRGGQRLQRFVPNRPLPPAISPLNPPGSILPQGLKRVQAAYDFTNFHVSSTSPGWAAGLNAVCSPISLNNIYDPLFVSNGELVPSLFNEYRPAVGHDTYATFFGEYVVVSAKVTVEVNPTAATNASTTTLWEYNVALCPTIMDQGAFEAQVLDFSNLCALGYPVKTVDRDSGKPLVHSVAVSMRNMFEMKESIANAGAEYGADFYRTADLEPTRSAKCMLVIRPTVDNPQSVINMRLKIEYLILPRNVKVPKPDFKVSETPQMTF